MALQANRSRVAIIPRSAIEDMARGYPGVLKDTASESRRRMRVHREPQRERLQSRRDEVNQVMAAQALWNLIQALTIEPD